MPTTTNDGTQHQAQGPTTIDLTDKPGEGQNLNPDGSPKPDDQNKQDAPEALDFGEGVTVPDRLKGKTAQEVADEFSNMHAEFGRQGLELGEARRLTRDIVHERLASKPTPVVTTKEPLTMEKFEENPGDAIAGIVKDAIKEAIAPLAETVEDNRQENTFQNFTAAYPDFQATVETPEFAAWVKETQYRVNQYNAANKHDYAAAEDILNAYKAHQDFIKPKGDAGETDDEKVARVAREQASATGTGTATKGKGKGKIYKAIDIQNEFTNNRELYNANLPEYTKAFDEDRVQ